MKKDPDALDDLIVRTRVAHELAPLIDGLPLNYRDTANRIANADVPGVAGQLADVVDVLDGSGQRDGRLRFASLETGLQHDGVEHHAEDAVACDHGFDHVVGELPLPVGELLQSFGQPAAAVLPKSGKHQCVLLQLAGQEPRNPQTTGQDKAFVRVGTGVCHL